jgi:hypothetical protein
MSGMSDTTLRDSVMHKTFKSSKELVNYCKPIQMGWFRCQAIAIGAAKLDPVECEIACRVAVKAATSESDFYRQVTPLAWPIDALASVGLKKQAGRLADDAIQQAMKVTPANSKAECLDVLYRHFSLLDISYRKRVFSELVRMAGGEKAWRIKRNCASIAMDLDRMGEREFIDDAISKCKDKKIIERIHRDRGRNNA